MRRRWIVLTLAAALWAALGGWASGQSTSVWTAGKTLLYVPEEAPASVTIEARVDLRQALSGRQEVWLAGLALDPEDSKAGLALRWSVEGGFFARWRLNLAAPKGHFPQAYVSGVDGDLEFIDLGVAVTSPSSYRAALSYDSSQQRVSISVVEEPSGNSVYSGAFRIQPLTGPLHPAAGILGGSAPSSSAESRWSAFDVREGYVDLGLLYDVKRDFKWRLATGEAADEPAMGRVEFFSDEQVWIGWEWPQTPVDGKLRIVVVDADGPKVVHETDWTDEAGVVSLPPLSEFASVSELRLEHVEGNWTQTIAQQPLRALPNRAFVRFETYGRNHFIDPERGDEPIDPYPDLTGRVIVVAERPLVGAALRVEAHYVPEEIRVDQDGARLVPLADKAQVFTVINQAVDAAANARLELPFAVSLPPERGRVELKIELADAELVEVEGASTPVFATPILPSFVGAEGWGMYTVGGRGGAVYEVTNLNDSGPGSLREAIEAEGPRTVVFRVSGTIELESDLVVRNPYLTIAGQTAPGDGITLKNWDLKIRADHVIVRFLRVRLGAAARKELEGISIRDARQVIVDHASISWTIDQSISNWINGSDHTIQWTVLSEPLHDSVHSKGPHGFAASVGGPQLSMHHNVFANSPGRNPSLAGPVRMDFRNNVIFNWQHRSIDGGATSINIVNNYFRYGPATQTNLRHRIVRVDNPPVYGIGRYYVDGNYVHGFPEITADNWAGGVIPDGAFDLALAREHAPFKTPPVVTQSAEDALDVVLEYVGAVVPNRDAVDHRIAREIREGQPTYGIGVVNDVSEVDGWPVLTSLDPPADSDGDGIPDAWELAHGLDPFNPDDARQRQDGVGFTYLEIYLDELAAPAFPPWYLDAWRATYQPGH